MDDWVEVSIVGLLLTQMRFSRGAFSSLSWISNTCSLVHHHIYPSAATFFWTRELMRLAAPAESGYVPMDVSSQGLDIRGAQAWPISSLMKMCYLVISTRRTLLCAMHMCKFMTRDCLGAAGAVENAEKIV